MSNPSGKRFSNEDILRMLGAGNVPLHITFDEKDGLKKRGIRWHPTLKLWFCNESKLMYPELKSRVSTFDTSGAVPELVPASSWNSNLRAVLPKEDWKKISGNVCSHGICMNCGGRGSAIDPDKKSGLEAHEEWSYDDKNKVQKLVRIVALCPDCHLIRHMGFASTKGWSDSVRMHMESVTGMTRTEAINIINKTFDEFEERSRHEWTLDITILPNYLTTHRLIKK